MRQNNTNITFSSWLTVSIWWKCDNCSGKFCNTPDEVERILKSSTAEVERIRDLTLSHKKFDTKHAKKVLDDFWRALKCHNCLFIEAIITASNTTTFQALEAFNSRLFKTH